MTEQNPAIFLQAGSHPAEDVRRWMRSLVRRGGIVNPGDLLVSQKSGTPNMSVDVAGGSAYILGTEATYQGVYYVENRGTTNLTIAAADATNPRIDRVVAKVRDAAYSGGTSAWSLAVVTGTAAASPSAPAVPANAISLATVAVAALASSITNANITDLRPVFVPAGGSPVGAIQPYAGSTSPAGWLLCDGSAVSRTAYADLFAVIDVTYGAGDTSTTFNLPNLKGRTIVGRDAAQTEFDTLGEPGGAKTHTLQGSEIPAHNHSGNTDWMSADHVHNPSVGDAVLARTTGSGIGFAVSGSGTTWATLGGVTANHYHSITLGGGGGGGAHNNLQPYLTLNYLIRA